MKGKGGLEVHLRVSVNVKNVNNFNNVVTETPKIFIHATDAGFQLAHRRDEDTAAIRGMRTVLEPQKYLIAEPYHITCLNKQ